VKKIFLVEFELVLFVSVVVFLVWLAVWVLFGVWVYVVWREVATWYA